jgi:hypothetical protein
MKAHYEPELDSRQHHRRQIGHARAVLAENGGIEVRNLVLDLSARQLNYLVNYLVIYLANYFPIRLISSTKRHSNQIDDRLRF